MTKEKRNITVTANSKIERVSDDMENIIFTADGTIEDDGKKITIKYTEPAGEQKRETKNVFTFEKDKREEVTLSRQGGINSLMMFKKGGRYSFTYDLGFASLEMCTNTIDVLNSIDFHSGGRLGMNYVTESRGVPMQKVKFTLTVK